MEEIGFDQAVHLGQFAVARQHLSNIHLFAENSAKYRWDVRQSHNIIVLQHTCICFRLMLFYTLYFDVVSVLHYIFLVERFYPWI